MCGYVFFFFFFLRKHCGRVVWQRFLWLRSGDWYRPPAGPRSSMRTFRSAGLPAPSVPSWLVIVCVEYRFTQESGLGMWKPVCFCVCVGVGAHVSVLIQMGFGAFLKKKGGNFFILLPVCIFPSERQWRRNRQSGHWPQLWICVLSMNHFRVPYECGTGSGAGVVDYTRD